jgi:glutamate 5-kinase
MITKILAAKRSARSGADTVIACGREHDVLSAWPMAKALVPSCWHPPTAWQRASNGWPTTSS